jgi:hypothetical protein
MFINFRLQLTLSPATLRVTARVYRLRYSELLKYRWEIDSAEHFGQRTEFHWYYSAFGIVHGDVFKTERGLLNAAVVQGCR